MREFNRMHGKRVEFLCCLLVLLWHCSLCRVYGTPLIQFQKITFFFLLSCLLATTLCPSASLSNLSDYQRSCWQTVTACHICFKQQQKRLVLRFGMPSLCTQN